MISTNTHKEEEPFHDVNHRTGFARLRADPPVVTWGYYCGRVERNLFWVTDGTYQSAFLATDQGIVLFDAPPTIGHNLQRAIDEVAEWSGQ